VARRRIGKAILETPAVVYLLSRIATVFLRMLGATWRFSIEGPDPFKNDPAPHLGAFWHRDAFIAAFVFRDRGFSVPVSRSRDGDLITQLLVGLGYQLPPRGSSSRGGAAALKAITRMVDDGTTVSIQTDGPRGPARVSKHGMVSLARRTGRPISPLAFSAKPCIQFKSWDRTLLPLPFARVVCRFGEGITVPQEATHEEEDAFRYALDCALNELTDQLDDRFGIHDPNRTNHLTAKQP
jgi:lysophospholipid acyltransferase (LPLAT)-like uncharacterized protein